MSVEYRIPAIPTMYDGIQYRSRLEAKWGAFFGLLGWKFEYEPFELNGWIPDFLIHGCHHPILVEVKPVTTFPGDVADKMERAAKTWTRIASEVSTCQRPIGEIHWTEEREVPTGELMIVGCAVPISYSMGSGSQIGWINDCVLGGATSRWADASVAATGGRMRELSTYQGSWIGRITGRGWVGKSCFGETDNGFATSLWREAGNIVQWKGKRSKAT